MAPTSSEFKVIVVGGGLSGLALACSLERAGIDYVVLESRDEVAPQIGASIAMLPNGMRLLDQLGVLEKVQEGGVMHESDTKWTGGNGGEKGRKPESAKVIHSSSGDMDFAIARHGYGVIFLERQKLLQELYNAITDKSKFRTGRKVKIVEHSEEEVVVRCENGEVYRGDVLLGADGTYSLVRSEMRKLIDEKDDTLLKEDKKGHFVEYSCLYGISTPTPGIETASMHRAYNRGLSCLTVGGINDTYWFLFKRLDKKYYAGEIPRYTQADADAQAAEHMDFVVGGTDGKTTIGDMWKRKKVGGLQPMDEGHNDHWTFGRIACVGDSAHKVTANAGTGGNLCLEGTAAVTNALYKLLHSQENNFVHQNGHGMDQNGSAKLQNGSTKEKKVTKQKPDFKAVEAALKAYHDGRKVRAKSQVKSANHFTRIEDFATLKEEFFAKVFVPNCGGLLSDLFSNSLVGATKFDFLPLPKKGLGVNMPYNPKYGITKGETLWKRALWALPLLAVFVVARKVLLLGVLEELGPLILEATTQGTVRDGTSSVPLRMVFTGWKALDNFILPFVAVFTPSMAGLGGSGLTVKNTGDGVVDLYAPQRMQAVSFFTDYLAFNAIWMIESCRRGNIFTFARLPVIFLLLAQMFGIGVIAPIYFFFHYVLIPSTKFHAADNRHIPLHLVKTILPTLILGYVVPTIGSYWPTSAISTLQAWNFSWQLFPMYLSIIHRIFSSFLPDTELLDRINNVKGDIFWLRLIYLTTFILSSTTWIYTFIALPTSLFQVFLSGVLNSDMKFKTLEEAMCMFLKYDEFFCFGSAAIWILLCFGDLKREGRLTAGWGKVLAVYGSMTLAFGPGAGLVGMWGWREDVLARAGLEE